MPNPFPGVNPFIEATGLWISFHNMLIVNCTMQLNSMLPSNYAALNDVRVQLVETSSDRGRHRRPDVGIVRDPDAETSGGVAVLPSLQTATLTLPEFESIREAFIDIVTLPDRELVTCIEILSPTNKSCPSSGDYHSKRAAMIGRGINLVEIDLLLQGDRLSFLEPLPVADYYAFVSRANLRPRCNVFGWSIRSALPRIPIPLKVGDDDATLDLSAAFSATYDGGRFHQTLRYNMPLAEELAPGDREWALDLAKSPA